MILEPPVLSLGLAGFSPEQAALAAAAIESVSHRPFSWRVAPFAEADAWWINGARTLLMPNGTLRVGAGDPSARAIHLNMQEVDRPLAFARPLPSDSYQSACHFELESPLQCAEVIERFSGWLRPVVAQFSLGEAIIEHQASLGGGAFEVHASGRMVAVVNMRGNVGVLPTAMPPDFEDALWRRCAVAERAVPEHFARCSLSYLMWQYALRTRRELLPAHYHTGLLYFRRPPRLPQRLLHDSHLLLLRELAVGCGTLMELRQRTGMTQAQIVRDLAALYLVGAITSNRKRAAGGSVRRNDVADSLASAPPSIVPASVDPRRHAPTDLTAPAPLVRDC